MWIRFSIPEGRFRRLYNGTRTATGLVWCGVNGQTGVEQQIFPFEIPSSKQLMVSDKK